MGWNPFKKKDGGTVLGNLARGITTVVKELNVPIVSQVAAAVNQMQGTPPVLAKPEVVSNGASPEIVNSKTITEDLSSNGVTAGGDGGLKFNIKQGIGSFIKSGLGGMFSYFTGTVEGEKLGAEVKQLWWEENAAKIYSIALVVVVTVGGLIFYFTRGRKPKYRR